MKYTDTHGAQGMNPNEIINNLNFDMKYLDS